MPVIIACDNLTRRYGPRRGIERVSLAVSAGQVFGFLGPNGAGKTTAIRVFLGFLQPSSGGARIFGLDCWRHSTRIKRDVGYVPGDLRLPAWINGKNALRIVGAVRGMDLIRPGRDLAERFDLDLLVRVRNMSRGMRQKLGLILSLAHRPRLLILDEPTGGLDPLMQREFHSILREMASKGHTIFFSSHTLSEVEQMCDRVAIVREGLIVADDTLEALRRRAGHDVLIRWKDSAGTQPPQPPAFMQVHARDGLTWQCSVDGPLDPLLRWLAQQSVQDLTINRPDLETLFRRYYESPASEIHRRGAENTENE